MSENVNTDGEGGSTRRPRVGLGRHELPPHPASGYAFRVVEYEGRPDECTICPRSLSRAQLLTTWITANRRLCVDLGANR